MYTALRITKHTLQNKQIDFTYELKCSPKNMPHVFFLYNKIIQFLNFYAKNVN